MARDRSITALSCSPLEWEGVAANAVGHRLAGLEADGGVGIGHGFIQPTLVQVGGPSIAVGSGQIRVAAERLVVGAYGLIEVAPALLSDSVVVPAFGLRLADGARQDASENLKYARQRAAHSSFIQL